MRCALFASVMRKTRWPRVANQPARVATCALVAAPTAQIVSGRAGLSRGVLPASIDERLMPELEHQEGEDLVRRIDLAVEMAVEQRGDVSWPEDAAARDRGLAQRVAHEFLELAPHPQFQGDVEALFLPVEDV